tara:strand:+ start:64 stop:303 length:240 start_codon:yes stop_codon:yes gene_type:complete
LRQRLPRLNNYEGKNRMKDIQFTDKELTAWSWVKKLGQWHLSGGNGQTLCGVPMLGNNYAKYIPENERTKCAKCFGGRS